MPSSSSSLRLSKILNHLREYGATESPSTACPSSPSSAPTLVTNNQASNSNSNNSTNDGKIKIVFREYPLRPSTLSLSGKTIFVSGGSRGIGLEIALKCARDGCNIAIAAKTATPHPKLPGTIYTAAEQIEALGSKALPIICDIRSETAVQNAVAQCVAAFGGIDIVINNASAISLTSTTATTMKRFDLMHAVNARGTFLVTKHCIPHLKQSHAQKRNPHILTMSPPLNMDERWFASHLAYTVSKYGMSMCCLGWSRELKRHGIASNALWPRTAIATSAVKFKMGGDESMRRSRNCQIMADSAYLILTQCSDSFTGQFVLDEDILRCSGVTDFQAYKLDPSIADNQLFPDFFL